MNVEKEVIVDLLPVYFSGEASPATLALVEDYFRQDSEFERVARSAYKFVGNLKTPLVIPEPAREQSALQRARDFVRYRNQMLGFSIAYSLFPLAFLFHNGRFVWIMMRDTPALAMAFGAVAAGCWIAFFILNYRVRRSGL